MLTNFDGQSCFAVSDPTLQNSLSLSVRDPSLTLNNNRVQLIQLSLVIPSWVGAISTSQRAVMPCGWGVKAGMVRV